MGLDTTHDCWHGGYTSFGVFRAALCAAAGLGDLNSYIGFGGRREFPDHPLTPLLDHSDCDGEIAVDRLPALIAELERLAPQLDERWRERAIQFAKGARDAVAANEPIGFH